MDDESFEIKESRKTGDGWRTLTLRGNNETDIDAMQKQIQKANQVIEAELK